MTPALWFGAVLLGGSVVATLIHWQREIRRPRGHKVRVKRVATLDGHEWCVYGSWIDGATGHRHHTYKVYFDTAADAWDYSAKMLDKKCPPLAWEVRNE